MTGTTLIDDEPGCQEPGCATVARQGQRDLDGAFNRFRCRAYHRRLTDTDARRPPRAAAVVRRSWQCNVSFLAWPPTYGPGHKRVSPTVGFKRGSHQPLRKRTNPGEGITTPSSGAFNAAATGNAWSLNTTGMKACGYVAEVVVLDRTIVASQGQGWVNSASVGFCLEESAEEGPALSP